MDDNSRLWDASGNWRAQGIGAQFQYVPNYDAILKWIKDGPKTLPPSLRLAACFTMTPSPTRSP